MCTQTISKHYLLEGSKCFLNRSIIIIYLDAQEHDFEDDIFIAGFIPSLLDVCWPVELFILKLGGKWYLPALIDWIDLEFVPNFRIIYKSKLIQQNSYYVLKTFSVQLTILHRETISELWQDWNSILLFFIKIDLITRLRTIRLQL